MKALRAFLIAGLMFIQSPTALAATLTVGPDQAFARIEDAYKIAAEGDTILVYPLHNDLPYEKTSLSVFKSGITFRAAVPWVMVSGEGFDYTDQEARAVFQFNPGADDCVLEGFEIFGAHNRVENGAGVRINCANNIRLVNCLIYGNDMGVMSNGDGTGLKGRDQKIERCRIYNNGGSKSGHFYHNLYMDGESVFIDSSEIYGSIGGHNVKSRAHFTLIKDSYIHDSSDREIDIVDSWETWRPFSDAVLIGNLIVKDPNCSGNRHVIHFGEDKGSYRDGTIYLIGNTIETFFTAAVVRLSSPTAKSEFSGNHIFVNGERVTESDPGIVQS